MSIKHDYSTSRINLEDMLRIPWHNGVKNVITVVFCSSDDLANIGPWWFIFINSEVIKTVLKLWQVIWLTLNCHLHSGSALSIKTSLIISSDIKLVKSFLTTVKRHQCTYFSTWAVDGKFASSPTCNSIENLSISTIIRISCCHPSNNPGLSIC